MKKLICTSFVLLLLLSACTAQQPEQHYTHGLYELTFSVQQLSGGTEDIWDFSYIYNGETVSSGHQLLLSLELFTFHAVQVKATQRGAPDNSYTDVFSVAICDGGSGKTTLAVTAADGTAAQFAVTCTVKQVGGV